jgi:hypothetical protein
MRLLAYCLLPNHFHLALWPRGDGDLSDYMGWLLTAHVRRYHKHYHSSGHVWQGRFRAFPIQEDSHLLTVLRYIERNPSAPAWCSGHSSGRGPAPAPRLRAGRRSIPAPCPGRPTGSRMSMNPKPKPRWKPCGNAYGEDGPSAIRRGWHRQPPGWDWKPACVHAADPGTPRPSPLLSLTRSLPSNKVRCPLFFYLREKL